MAGDPAIPPAEKLPKAERKVLTALAQHGACSKRKVAILAGYAVKGGAFGHALGHCRGCGWIQGSDPLEITEAGLAVLGEYDPLPTGPALTDHWLRQLPKAEREILTVLLEAAGGRLTKQEIAERTASVYAADGGSFNNALGRLRSLGLVEGSRELSLGEDLLAS